MLRALCLAMTVCLLPCGFASAQPGPGLEANAALKYWQAFATLPRMTDAEQTRLNAECLTMPLDAHANELVAKAEYALRMLHRGAALPRCAWETAHEEGIYVRLSEGPAARALSALACLRSRLRFAAGKTAEGIDDIVAVLTLSRHVSAAGTNIMLLVGYALEHRAIDLTALILPKLNAETIKRLKTRLDALPSGMTVATALASEEKFYLDWFVRAVKEAKDKESLLDLLVFVGLQPEGKVQDFRAAARTFLEECGGTADHILKFADQTRACYTLMAKKLDLPLDRFEKEFESEAKKQAGNPVFKVFFPALVNMRRAQARTEVRRALMAAALAVQLDGRDALKQHSDPVIGGPFEYVAFDGGFELHSKLKGRDDKPVVLTVGLRAK